MIFFRLLFGALFFSLLLLLFVVLIILIELPRIAIGRMEAHVRLHLVKRREQVMRGGQHAGVDHGGDVRRLIHVAGQDVIVSLRRHLYGRVSELFSDYVQNRFLAVKKNILDAGHVAAEQERDG